MDLYPRGDLNPLVTKPTVDLFRHRRRGPRLEFHQNLIRHVFPYGYGEPRERLRGQI